jgi:hypothetical protein
MDYFFDFKNRHYKKSEQEDLNHPLYRTFPERTPFFNRTNECAYFEGSNYLFEGGVESRSLSPLPTMFRITDKESISYYLNYAKDYDEVFIDMGIFCVINVSDYLDHYDYQTLVFYEDGVVIKSNESANTVMGKLFCKAGVGYNQIRFIIQSIEGKAHHGSPYVLGKASYLPLRGPSKKDVTWVSLGHLVHFRKLSKEHKRIRLEFKKRHSIDIDMAMDVFQRHIDSASYFFSCQHLFLDRACHLFGMFPLPHDEAVNPTLLHRIHHSYRLNKQHTLEEMVILMMLSLWREFVRDEPFKENPLVDDINDFLARKFPSYF